MHICIKIEQTHYEVYIALKAATIPPPQSLGERIMKSFSQKSLDVI